MRRMMVVGVTGGIGSGKTEVCKVLARLGAEVIYADQLAKDLMESDRGLKRTIWREFGEVYNASGLLDRKKLAAEVFSSPEKTLKINAIVHPRVQRELRARIDQFRRRQTGTLLILEAALLYEAGSHRMCDYVIAVHTKREKALERVMRRDGVRRAEVIRRMRAQWSPAEKVRRADFVIHNNGDLHSLERKAEFVLAILMDLVKSRSSRHRS